MMEPAKTGLTPFASVQTYEDLQEPYHTLVTLLEAVF
jgi:hypothetical protein